MMGVRVACFILMVVITPYGWYTWVLGAAAILLPYIAVVSANVSENVRRTVREDPERALTAAPAEPASAPEPRAAAPTVIRLEETRPSDDATTDPADGRG